MKFIDLAAQQKRIREKIENNITTVLDHGQYIMGPEVEKLEERLAEFVGVKHAISCSSGTDALLMALMAYNVGQGDAIFTTPFTFIATAEVISFLGAIPIFVDIDPRTFNIDPDKLEQAILALKVNDHKLHPLPITHGQSSVIPKGIIAVDLFGLPADYERINAIAKKHDILVVEDAAQSFGGEYKGKRSCSLTDIACASFFPAKPLGGRMDTLQAAILLAKFEIFPEEIELRNQVARNYSELISAANKELSTPFVPYGYKSVWAQYSILAKNEKQRTDMQNRLKEVGIPTAIYYPIPLHLQTAFDGLGYKKGDFPISEDISSRIFSLPMHPYLKEEDQKNIAEIILEV